MCLKWESKVTSAQTRHESKQTLRFLLKIIDFISIFVKIRNMKSFLWLQKTQKIYFLKKTEFCNLPRVAFKVALVIWVLSDLLRQFLPYFNCVKF